MPDFHASNNNIVAMIEALPMVTLMVLSLVAVQRPSTPAIDSIDLGMSRLVVVKMPAGTFMMGTGAMVTGAHDWTNAEEHPVHQVTISHGFWMGRYPVTQAQWRAVMQNNPSYFQDAGSDHPVEQVTWNDVQSFLTRLNAAQRRWTVRLPTEAEWEYAARAGSTGETYGPVDDVAWYAVNGSRTTHAVGTKLPNAFGLYDMLGNVWEWCQDWFGPYSSTPTVDPQGPSQGDRRVTRGGCFYCDAFNERAARRNRDLVEHRWRSIGFRIVAVPR